MTLPPGFTDDMNIELPEDVTLQEVADWIFSMKEQGMTHEMIELSLVEKFALTPYDAGLAWDRVCAGIVRASTRSHYNCPDRRKDTLAWIAFQRSSQDWNVNARSNLQIALAGSEGTKPWWKFW